MTWKRSNKTNHTMLLPTILSWQLQFVHRKNTWLNSIITTFSVTSVKRQTVFRVNPSIPTQLCLSKLWNASLISSWVRLLQVDHSCTMLFLVPTYSKHKTEMLNPQWKRSLMTVIWNSSVWPSLSSHVGLMRWSHSHVIIIWLKEHYDGVSLHEKI